MDQAQSRSQQLQADLQRAAKAANDSPLVKTLQRYLEETRQSVFSDLAKVADMREIYMLQGRLEQIRLLERLLC